MKLTFLGAARTVTGSCYLLEVNGKKMLVDCGMFQGSKSIKAFNERPFAFNPAEIDAMVLTHAHVDHSGLIPRLVKEGFKGRVHCTKSTQQLCTILLPDSAHIQESDAEFANRKGLRAGKSEVLPIFTVDDAYTALQHFFVHNFEETFEVIPGVTAKLRVAGHILGSATVYLAIEENGKKTTMIFSGDVGQPKQPIVEDPSVLSGADYIITESTYGNRKHKAYDKEEELAKIINETVERGGNVVIPAFAVGRTQVLLYYFQKLSQEGKIPDVPIYVDSPLATKATGITLANKEEYDEETRALVEFQGDRLFAMKNVHFTPTPDESRMINGIEGPKIILSASGMADAGRILHHLKHNLWRPECTVVFAGYQAEGTMGRNLIDGVKKVKIMGETIHVAAQIVNMTGFSAHADKEQLIDWYKKMPQKPKIFFVTHGEFDAASELSKDLQMQMGTAVYVPKYGDSVAIDGADYVIEAAPEVETLPEVAELQDSITAIERNYMQYRNKMEQIALRDSAKADQMRKKLEKVRRYMDEMLGNL
ncbi:MAG: MBL fold metallo-hydrolase [Acidaminococcaceae bacterium]|nr:MBL fold metallo-hydrolase [Acidaminococcaceae bacterium]MBR6863173.1 MBL fold metallo-hydrolase [Acidaminococcaceae bacterium]